MDYVDVNTLILFFLCLVALILTWKKLRIEQNKDYLKLIVLYLILIVVQLAIGEYFHHFNITFRGKMHPVAISAYLFAISEYSILTTLIVKFLKLNPIRKYLIFSCLLFTMTAIIIWFIASKFEKAISITTTLESILLIPFCLYYFFDLLKDPNLLQLTDEPSFWITTGILFLFITITPFYLAVDYFKSIPEMQIIDYFGYDLIVFFFARSCLINNNRTNG